MNNFSSTKNRINPRNILGGILGSYNEEDFERETSLLSAITSTVTSAAKDMLGGVYEAAADLSQTVVIAEAQTESNNSGKFPSKGSLEFKNQAQQLEQLQKEQKDQKEANRQKAFFQTLKEEQERAQRVKDQLLEEAISDIMANLPTDQKNELLHYQANYRDKSVYQQAALRRKLIEQQKQADQKQKEATIPSPAKQPSAIEGAFEGRSGGQGSGTANLSAQAVG